MPLISQSAKTTSGSNKESSNSRQTRAENQSATIADKRPATLAQNRIMASMGSGSGVQRTAQLQAIMSGPAPVQRVKEDETQIKDTFVENNTGLPDQLKTGLENISGISLNDVQVYSNSSQPGELSAHAFAQGTDIHLAPGQEKHLPHEAWHVVQQKQGRVQPTKQMGDGVNVNDHPGLEREATQMGQRALNHTLQTDTPSIQSVAAPSATAQLWGWPFGKKEEKEAPAESDQAENDERDQPSERDKMPRQYYEGDNILETTSDMVSKRLSRRRAIAGDQDDVQDMKKNTPEVFPKSAGFNKEFQSRLGGMLSTEKTEKVAKKRDAIEEHALKQSSFADSAKPGEENSWGSWFKRGVNKVGRGLNNAKEAAKSSFGSTWLGKKMGVSGLNKNERAAADEKAHDIKQGGKVVDSYNKKGADLEGQTSKIGMATSVGAFVAGKAIFGGKVGKNLVKAGGDALKEDRFNKASEAYDSDKGDALINIGSQAKGKSMGLKGRQAHLSRNENLAAATGAAVDEVNPLGKLAHVVSEATLGYVELPSGEKVARNTAKALNYTKQSQINEESKNVNSGQALAFARQNMGGINREAFKQHKSKNAGLFAELGSKFDNGSSLGSKIGLSEKADPKLKEGVLNKVKQEGKATKKESPFGINEDMLARARAMPNSKSDLDDDDGWDD